MESRYYETIHETGHLQVRFEPAFFSGRRVSRTLA